jgi:hypothetical protein
MLLGYNMHRRMRAHYVSTCVCVCVCVCVVCVNSQIWYSVRFFDFSGGWDEAL